MAGGRRVIGTVTAVTATVVAGVAAGTGHHRLRRLVAGATGRTVWFHVHPPHHGLWGEPAPVSLDRSLCARLQGGLRTPVAPVLAVAPLPRPDEPTQRSYAGMAALGRPSGRVLVGVPADAAPVMPWAAAGCGMLARRLPRLPDGARAITGPVPVPALPGWMVGTDESGVPVTVNLPPGATVMVCGTAAATVVATVPVTGRVPGLDVTVIDTSGDAATGGTDATASRWRDAWHPQTCRMVCGATPPAWLPAPAVDLVVDLDAGEVTGRGARIPFRRLPVR